MEKIAIKQTKIKWIQLLCNRLYPIIFFFFLFFFSSHLQTLVRLFIRMSDNYIAGNACRENISLHWSNCALSCNTICGLYCTAWERDTFTHDKRAICLIRQPLLHGAPSLLCFQDSKSHKKAKRLPSALSFIALTQRGVSFLDEPRVAGALKGTRSLPLWLCDLGRGIPTPGFRLDSCS